MRQQVQLPGTVDSSPIYLKGVTVDGGTHDTLFVTTSYGITLAIDARTGAILWQYTPPSYAAPRGQRPDHEASPVADPSRKWIYVASPDGRIEKLSVADGSVAWRVWITKLPLREKIASSLNFADGHVIATTSGYFDVGAVPGARRDRSPPEGTCSTSGTRSARTAPSSSSRRRAPRATRRSGDARGAVVVPGSGNLLVATGNGYWDGKTDWGDAVIELSPTAKLIGNYTPTNTAELYNTDDLDLGSTSPAYLTPNLIAQGGKDRKIRLLSLSRMRGTAPHRGHEVQSLSTPGRAQLFTAPAVWRANRTWLIVADNAATEAWVLHRGRLHPVWQNSSPGTSPVIAGGLLYVYDRYGGG